MARFSTIAFRPIPSASSTSWRPVESGVTMRPIAPGWPRRITSSQHSSMRVLPRPVSAKMAAHLFEIAFSTMLRWKGNRFPGKSSRSFRFFDI